MNKNFINSVSGAMKYIAVSALMLVTTVRSQAQVTVTATAGTLGPTVYTQLRLAFNAINAGTHQGVITVSITANCAETNQAQLNPPTIPASYTSVLIKPAAATTPTISGSFNGGVIFLRGASNVTIDGSNTAGGTSRDLTIANNSAANTVAGVRFGSASAVVGNTNCVVKNCNIRCNGIALGMAVLSATGGAATAPFAIAEAPNTGCTIQNNALSNAQGGVYCYGPAATDQNWTITGNTTTGTGFNGIWVNNGTGTVISDNNISAVNMTLLSGSFTSGITLSFEAQNTTITRNKIATVNNTNAVGSYGIYFDINNTSAGVNAYNNFVLSPTCPASASVFQNAHGIYADYGSGINIYNNTVQLSTNTGGTNAAICIDPFAAPGLGPGTVNLRENIISNTQTTGTRYGLYSSAASTTFATIDYNDYVATSGNLGFIGGIARTTIAQIQAGFGSNVNSITFNPTFVSGTDLHLQPVVANAPLIVGVPILTPAITVDIDNELRHNVTPTLGAHEILNKITYTNLTNTCSDGNITLTPVTIESKLGITIAGALAPRIYFRKGAGTWFSAAGSLISGTATNSQWTFTITPATMGGVTAGDIISYYVIAQTAAGPTLVFSSPLTGLSAVDVNTVTTHPTTPNTYTVNVVYLTGLTTSQQLCYSTSNQSAPYAYTGTIGSPTQYTLTWAPAGPTDVVAFTAIPAGSFTAAVPGSTAATLYTGTLTVRNPTTTCSRVYTVSLTINPLPSNIVGAANICQGSSSVYTSSPGTGTWTSTNTAVGTVGASTGVVTGMSPGTTTIVYTLPSTCATSVVVTVAAPPAAIGGTGAICPGTTLTLTNTSAGGTWSTTALTATVNATSGVVTGMSQGTATISYNVTGCLPTTAVVTVNPIPNAITGSMYACVGDSTQLSTTSTGGTWSSSDTSKAKITSTGKVYGKAGGFAVITYKFTSTGCYVTNTVNVFPIPTPIDGSSLVCQGGTTQLSDTLTGGTWSSNLPGVIMIGSTSGIATGVAASGTARITYTLGTGCRAFKIMTVSTAPTAISGPGHIICSETFINLGNGTPGGTWSSSNTAVGTVSSTGVVYGVAGGTVIISYKTDSCNPATYAITVNQTPPPIGGGITICDGSSTTVITNSLPGGVWSISGGVWDSASASFIYPPSITTTGTVTGLTVGGTYVATYTIPTTGCFRNAPIIVDTLPAPITGPDSLCMGATTTLYTLSHGGLWSSNNASIASIVALTGVVTGVNYGVTTITYAAVSGCNRTKNFKVRTPLPAGVTITRNPAIDTLCAGTPVTFTAHHLNGGAAPTFEWQKFGVTIPASGDDSVYTYTPIHGDVISVYMMYSADVCSYPAPAYYAIPINVYPNVAPVVTISTTSNTTITYIGQVVTFFAVATTAGGSPTYQWYVDGVAVPGATNSSYARAIYDDDDVYCMVNGVPPCETGYWGTSNTIRIFGTYLAVNNVTKKGNELALFPNPNNGSFSLTGSIDAIDGDANSFDVVNVLGQVVYTGKLQVKNGMVNQNITLNKGLSAGAYILRVNSERENKLFHFVIGE